MEWELAASWGVAHLLASRPACDLQAVSPSIFASRPRFGGVSFW